MGTMQHFLNARRDIEQTRLADAVARARMGLVDLANSLEPVPHDWPAPPSPNRRDQAGIERLLQRMNDDPSHPANWQRRAVAREMTSQRVHEIYYRLRSALWDWEELADLRPGARKILETVIELARDEAFAWYVMVPAEQVRAIARLSEGRYASSVRELECLAVSRPAEVIECGDLGPKSTAQAPWKRDPGTCTAPPLAQWVVRYRRGIPWNAKRAAWWINYDLLCETGSALPCFLVSPHTLSQTYQHRNTPMGRVWPGYGNSDQLAATSRMLAQRGPLPPAGFRAPFWGV